MSAGINVGLATRIGALAARPGPVITSAEGIHLVADLHGQVAKAFGYVAEITGLDQAAARAAQSETLIVDRRGLIRSLINTVEELAKTAWKDEGLSWPARQTASAQLGALTGVMAYRVLGHYDPFYRQSLPLAVNEALTRDETTDSLRSDVTSPLPAGRSGGFGTRSAARSNSFSAVTAGRIVLAAPNILRFEREIEADPRDFHLWVALHEVTHAVQFAAAPWLADWLRERFEALIGADNEPGSPSEFLRAFKRLPDLFADEAMPNTWSPLLSPVQSSLLAQITAAMSLLEGHADIIMDAVGPKVVRTLEHLRPRFEARRLARGRLERAVRRAAGIEAKTAQYVQGAVFVRAGLAALGHEGFNAVFSSPATLPTAAEMDDPAAWIARISG